MPVFRYFCDECESEFEEVLIKSNEIEEFFDHHPCHKCNIRAERIRINSFSFGFKSSLPQGNTGVHSVDYPTLDLAVGRSAAKKKLENENKKLKRDKVRKESNTNFISQSKDIIKPLNKDQLKSRENGMKLYKKALKNPESSK